MNYSKSTSRLLDSAAAVLALDPSATLHDIAEGAGVGRATLHRHFPSRRDLVRTLTLDALYRLEAATSHIDDMAETSGEALQLLVAAVVPLGDRYRFLTSEPLRHDDVEIRVVYDKRHSRMTDLAQALKAEALIAPEIPTAWVVATIDALIFAAWEAVEAGDVARRDAPALVYRTLVSGMAPKP
jgi:AcrR family transcriptional regulator